MDRKTFEKQNPFAGEKKPSILGDKKEWKRGNEKSAAGISLQRSYDR